MLKPLSDELLARIKSRAANPDTRNDSPPSTRGRTVSMGGMSIVGLDLNAVLRGDADPRTKPSPSPLAAPVDDAALTDAEKKLGFALPVPLRQLYSQVGNGGFGPVAGIMPLKQLVDTYLDLKKNPPGQRGQTWPPHLLPITGTEPGHDCIDVNSGAMIFWDEEELADGPSDKVWKRSFKPDAADLGAWFEKWLGTPSPEQKMQDMMQKSMLSGIKASLDYWRARTPAERAAFGLPETGWEEKLFGHLGIDLSKL